MSPMNRQMSKPMSRQQRLRMSPGHAGPSQKSLKKEIRLIRATMLGMTGTMLLILLGLLFWTSSAHSALLSGYQNLQDYYYSVSESSDTVKNYLINEAEKDLTAYHQAVDRARASVDRLQSNPYIQEKWRLDLLDNMLDSYETSVSELERQYRNSHGSRGYQYYYENFLEKEERLQQTSTAYYHLLTESMHTMQIFFEQIRMISLAAALICAALTMFWTWRLGRFFVVDLEKPFLEISENISAIRNGDYSLTSADASTVEISQIYQALDDMAGKVRHSIEIEKENTTLEKRLAQSELRMLQNQINPHFLFNTLNMIYCMCENEESEQAGEMIFKTTHLLRYGLENQSRISTLAKEISSLSDYIEIQRCRYRSKIQIELKVDLPQGTLELPVPAMILQPLVENAILHGLKNVLRDGIINVHIQQEAEHVSIRIEDNGMGISSSRLLDILRQNDNIQFFGSCAQAAYRQEENTQKSDSDKVHLSPGTQPSQNVQTSPSKKTSDPVSHPSSFPAGSPQTESSGGLGLFNVLQRMEMLYGDHFHCSIESTPGQGTVVEFLLDFKEAHV